MATSNSWDSLTNPKVPVPATPNPYPFMPSLAPSLNPDADKAIAMKNYIMSKNILPSEIDALATAKSAGVDVVKILHEATPKDERDQRIDALTSEIGEIKNALKALLSEKGQNRNGNK